MLSLAAIVPLAAFLAPLNLGPGTGRYTPQRSTHIVALDANAAAVVLEQSHAAALEAVVSELGLFETANAAFEGANVRSFQAEASAENSGDLGLEAAREQAQARAAP